MEEMARQYLVKRFGPTWTEGATSVHINVREFAKIMGAFAEEQVLRVLSEHEL